MSSVKELEVAKSMPEVHYMRMPVTQFGTMEFGKVRCPTLLATARLDRAQFGPIMDIGYDFAKKSLAEWIEKGDLPKVQLQNGSGDAAPRKPGARIRRASI